MIGHFVERVVFTVDLHLDLAFLGAEHNRLLAKPADHVERALGHTAQREFLHVSGNATLDDLPQMLNQVHRVTVGASLQEDKPVLGAIREERSRLAGCVRTSVYPFS